MTTQIPHGIYEQVEPIAKAQGVPDPLWESVAFQESGFNPRAVGDQNTSFGLFQLHMGGQLPVQYNGCTSGNCAVFDPSLNAQIAMPAIGGAWRQLGRSFDPNNYSWWQQFAIMSGHPGGSIGNESTDAEASALMNDYKLFTNGNSPMLTNLPSGSPLVSLSTGGNTCEQPGGGMFGQPATVDCSSPQCNIPVVGGIMCSCCVGKSVSGQDVTPGNSTNNINSQIGQVGLVLFGAVIIIIAIASMINPKNLSIKL